MYLRKGPRPVSFSGNCILLVPYSADHFSYFDLNSTYPCCKNSQGPTAERPVVLLNPKDVRAVTDICLSAGNCNESGCVRTAWCPNVKTAARWWGHGDKPVFSAPAWCTELGCHVVSQHGLLNAFISLPSPENATEMTANQKVALLNESTSLILGKDQLSG